MANKNKLYIVNQRMLKWMEYSIQTKVVDTQKEWCEKIGFPVNNMAQVRSGAQGFTLQQIENAAALIKGNMNWLWDLETNILRISKPLTPLELLRQATAAMESQYGFDQLASKKNGVNKKVNTKKSETRKSSSLK